MKKYPLEVQEVKPNWFIGRSEGLVVFGLTAAECVGRYRAAIRKQLIAALEGPRGSNGAANVREAIIFDTQRGF